MSLLNVLLFLRRHADQQELTAMLLSTQHVDLGQCEKQITVSPLTPNPPRIISYRMKTLSWIELCIAFETYTCLLIRKI